MSFFSDYPVFSTGRFFDREGHIKAHIDKDFLVRTEYDGKIVGRIRDGKLYDETMNYVGYFKNGALHSLEGSIMGFCNGWKVEDVKKEIIFDSFLILFWGIGVIICLWFVFLEIMAIFSLL